MSNETTLKQAWSIVSGAVSWLLATIIGWMRHIALFLIVASILVMLLEGAGIPVPFETPDHMKLIYIAGAYWLSK